MQIITTAVIKGGTGKTTTAGALAQAARADKKRVLAIDLDPQGNLSFILAADPGGPGSYELLHGARAQDVIQTTAQGIDVITASANLATERTTPASARRLADGLEPVKKKYDFIFIDTPPEIGEMTFNALTAATGLIIPLEADISSLAGLNQIAGIAHQIQRKSPQLAILGTVVTRYDGRPKINRYLLETIASKGAEVGAPNLATIRPGVAIKEAQALQESLFEYAPGSNPAKDYKALYEAIRGRKKK